MYNMDINYEKDVYEYLKYDIIKRLCFEKGGTLNETYHSGWIECITGSMFDNTKN